MAGFGPPLLNFAPLANLGKTFFDAQESGIKRQERELKRQTLATLGQDFQSGNFGGAAQKLAALGDVSGAAALFGLGQKVKESAREDEWLRNNAGILGGGAAAPAASTGSQPSIGFSPGAPQLPATTAPIIPGDRSLPRGIRNNNPGNIEAGSFTQGLPGFQGSDGRFARFETPEQGIIAADKLLQSYANRGLNTVSGIVNRWAPPSENNTGAYAASVARELGVAPNEPLNMQDPSVRQKLITAKIRVENGRQPYGEDVFARAYGRGGVQVAAPITPVQQAPLSPPGVQVAENEADVQRLEAEMAARQGAPLQVAQAPGAPVADMPAPGAAPVQGFAVPGTPADASIASDPRVVNLQRALAGAPDRFKPAIQSRLNILVEELKAQRQQNAPTNTYRDYERARTDPAYRDFLKEQRAQTNVTVDQRAQSEEEKTLGQAAGKRAGETMAAAAGGTKQLQRIGQLEALMKNVETGKLQPGRMSIAALGKSLGVNEDFLRGLGFDPAQVGDAQALNSIAGRMVVDMIGSGGFPSNNFSNTDREFITGTVPSLANDPRGNKLIMEVAKRTAQIDIEKAKEWREWRKTNKGGSFDDFEVQWNDNLSSKDRFADLAKQAEAIIGAKQPAAKDWQDLGGGLKIRRVQ